MSSANIQRGIKIPSSLEDYLIQHVLGHDEICTEVAAYVDLMLCPSFGQPEAPLVFVFAGPSRVGKTELAKRVSEWVNRDTPLNVDTLFDMGKVNDASLFGVSPGYAGFENGSPLYKAACANPKGVIIFDDVEKADIDIIESLKPFLGEGRLSGNRNETRDFRGMILILTTNLGSQEILERASKKGKIDQRWVDTKYRKILLNHFNNEAGIVGRLTNIFCFARLSQ